MSQSGVMRGVIGVGLGPEWVWLGLMEWSNATAVLAAVAGILVVIDMIRGAVSMIHVAVLLIAIAILVLVLAPN